MSKESLPFVVPEELTPQIDDHVLKVHEAHAAHSLEPYSKRTKEVEVHPQGAILHGSKDGDPEAGINVLALPHQQAWKPSMVIRSMIHHEINNPDGVSIFLPNNSRSNKSYDFSEDELEKINSGDMKPFYEMQTRTVERFLKTKYPGRALGNVALDGYSLGGLTSLGIASVGSDMLDVRKVHSVEAPSKQTTPKALQKDFMKSGGFGKQRKAVKDASIPALSKLHRHIPLAVDYARFGIASVTDTGNKALANAMANPRYNQLVEAALTNYPDAEIHAGYIAGSKLFDPQVVEYIRNPRFHVEFYGEGPGSHKHATGDNVMAHALMMKR